MDKVLLITGASTGIGAATAKLAASRGWKVALLARSADKLDALASEIGEAALPLPCDATDAEAQGKAVAQTVEKWGRLDAAFANAGRGTSGAGFEGGDLSDWRKMLDLNIWALLATCKHAMPELRKTRGHMLLTGSRAGRTEMKGSVYSATKHFVHAFGANLSLEMKEWGGRCTIVAPGMVDTPFFDSPKPEGLTAEDVAEAAVWALERPDHVSVGEVFVMPNRG